jgi:hypothetical protein
VDPVCETCRVLLNSLRDTKGRLAQAASRLRELIGAGRPEEFRVALLEAQSLRMEVEAIRAELEYHKAQHDRPG